MGRIGSNVNTVEQKRPLTALNYGLLLVLVITLMVTNVLTLVDDSFHTNAYTLVERVIKSFSDGSLLANSTTEIRKRDTAVATSILAQENNKLARQALDLTNDAVAIASEMKVLRAEKVALAVAAKSWEEKHNVLQDRVLKNRASVQRLAKSLSQRLIRNTSRAVAGVFGKSLPYLGIGVTLTMTSLDLNDACETIKELNQVSQTMDLPREDENTICGAKIPSKTAVIDEISRNWKTAYLSASDLASQAGQNISAPPTTDELVSQASSLLLGFRTLNPISSRK